MHPDRRRAGRAIRKQRRLIRDATPALQALTGMSIAAARASLALSGLRASLALSGLGAAFATIGQYALRAALACEEAAAAKEASEWARGGSIAYMEIDGVSVLPPLAPADPMMLFNVFGAPAHGLVRCDYCGYGLPSVKDRADIPTTPNLQRMGFDANRVVCSECVERARTTGGE